MGILAVLMGYVGEWAGENKLWFDGNDARISASRLSVSPVAGGKFVRADYTWGYEGKPQDGSILIGFDSARDVVTAVWVDSWHMGEKAMSCDGSVAADGTVIIPGSYAAPPGPDWGWRIEIGAGPVDALVMRMFNVSPAGKEDLAVEAVYRRA
jgi:hypothetical protein